jgi:hypothetical protein
MMLSAPFTRLLALALFLSLMSAALCKLDAWFGGMKNQGGLYQLAVDVPVRGLSE